MGQAQTIEEAINNMNETGSVENMDLSIDDLVAALRSFDRSFSDVSVPLELVREMLREAYMQGYGGGF